MELTRTEEQDELAAMVRQLLDRRADSGAVRAAMASEGGHDPELWSTLCEQVGVAALPVPEEAGGAGYGFAESFVVLEELGRALAPSPLVGTLVATGALLSLRHHTAGGHADADVLLGRIAAGEPAALATDAARVVDGDTAAIVLAVREDGLVVLDSPATRHVPAMDPTLRLAEVDTSGAATVLATGDAADAAVERARLVGATAAAVLGVGAMQRGLDMTVAHTREREQFGRPIGSFQALKHRMADMLVLLEMSRSAARAAVWAVSTDHGEAHRHVAVAAAYVGEAALRLAGEVVQLHGGIAITWEHDAQLVFKRAHAVGQLWGQPHQHRAALA